MNRDDFISPLIEEEGLIVGAYYLVTSVREFAIEFINLDIEETTRELLDRG